MSLSDLADEYFNRSFQTVADRPEGAAGVLYAIFSRGDGLMYGLHDVIALLESRCPGPLEVRALREGTPFAAREMVMTIQGPFRDLVATETEILGHLSLCGAAATMRAMVEAAGAAEVVDMAARHYPPGLTRPLAVAAAVGGAAGTSTRAGHDEVHRRFGIDGGLIRVGDGPARPFALYGSIPHALNAVFGGSSVDSGAAYHQAHPEVPLTLLIDFEGRERDVVADAVQRLGSQLSAIRLDTGGQRVHQGGHEGVDRALEMRILSESRDRASAAAALERYGFGKGVTIEMVFAMRDLLDRLGGREVRIVVSSGFTLEKVKAFVACRAPIDAIGTGSWVSFSLFTADIIRVEEGGRWIPRCKVGRREEMIEREDLQVVLKK